MVVSIMKNLWIYFFLCWPVYATAMLTTDEMIEQGKESFKAKDCKTAQAYYLRAAERGNKTAQLQLSYWYLSGRTHSTNLTLGQFWLTEALEPRVFGPADLVGIYIGASFYQSNIDVNLALDWLILGAKHDDTKAKYLLLCRYMGLLPNDELIQQLMTWLTALNQARDTKN